MKCVSSTHKSKRITLTHSQLSAISNALIPALKSIRQKEFYSEPRFHASIGWALMSTNPGPKKAEPVISPNQDCDKGDVGHVCSQFPTVSSLPKELISTLREEFGSSLLTKSVGSFSTEALCVRIGKDVSRWSLGSN